MAVEEITAYEYTCRPMGSFPIRSMVVTIYAKNREEADEIFDRHAHQFFDQDITRSTQEFGGGYRQVDERNSQDTCKRS